MSQGHVLWFNENKGYGYIKSESGDDVFVHFSAIKMDGFRTLPKGALVKFDYISGEKGPLATKVVPVGRWSEAAI